MGRLRRSRHSDLPRAGRSYNFNPIVGNKDLERDLTTALDDSGLEVYDLYSSYIQPEIDWDADTPALEYGGRIGCKYVLAIADDPEWNRLVDNTCRFVDIVEPLGMKAVFEAFARPAVADHTIVAAMDTCVKFVEACKPKHLGMCLNDQPDTSGPTGTTGILLGDGFVPPHEYLDALPNDIDISVEAQMPPGAYTGAEWWKVSVDRIRRYLDRHDARAPEPSAPFLPPALPGLVVRHSRRR